LCPRNCNVDRINEIGFCKATEKVKVALVSSHYFEEPCISGELYNESVETQGLKNDNTESLFNDKDVVSENKNENEKENENEAQKGGSGTIFFSNCNLRCIYCQNYEISHEGKGIEITTHRLAEIMLEQQERGAYNINLVTPTMYVPQIIEAIKEAKKLGLKIPIVYNTNAYENVETLKKLNGLIDIYLPDLKYYYDDIAVKYSKAPNYFERATNAILEMQCQVPDVEIDENGIMKKGVIVRHLVLPNNIENSKQILRWMKNNLNDSTYVSIMAQYFPTYEAKQNHELNRKLTKEEYQEILNFAEELNFENGFIQELSDCEEEYVPKFDFSNVLKKDISKSKT